MLGILQRRWSRSARLFAALAAIAAAASFMLVDGYARRVEALAPALGRPVDVVVAARDLARGARLDVEALSVRRFPSAFVPAGAIRSIDRAVGHGIVADVGAGEIITWKRLATTDAGPVASLVPEGLRAFAVATALPADAVRAGDRVDVLATFAGGRPHTETVASSVEVLLVATGGRVSTPEDPEGGGAGVVVTGGIAPVLFLLVSAEQAERLAYARAFADLSVTIAAAEEEP